VEGQVIPLVTSADAVRDSVPGLKDKLGAIT
jgi:hypothetical protein